MMMEMLGRTGRIYSFESHGTHRPSSRPPRELPLELDDDPKSYVSDQHAAKSLKSLCFQWWSLGG